MNSKMLNEREWKAIAQKYKLKDTSLQKALFLLDTIDEDEYAGRLKGIDSVIQFAGTVKKSKEAAANPPVVKYLDSLRDAAQSERDEIVKAKAAAEKAQAEAKKNAEAEAKQRQDTEDDGSPGEAAQSDYTAKLVGALQKLKSSQGQEFEFIVCDAKPLGLMVAKEISASHRAQLIKLTGGKKFFPVGTCTFVDGKYHFNLAKPITGLAPKLQESIKHYTGKKLPIIAGGETADDPGADWQTADQAAPAAKPVPPKLAKAPELWNQTCNAVSNSIDALKVAIRAAVADEVPGVLDGLDDKLARLDGISAKFDQRLAESLAKVQAVQDAAARNAALAAAKTILVDYINYVKSEPLIAHIDANPFGVKTNLKQTLAQSLTTMAQAIG